ncbi:hypothetical protein ACFSLT_09740 [Novosphingobium resinovorum]
MRLARAAPRPQAPVGEGNVEPQFVPVPLRADRLDAHAHGEEAVLFFDPHVDRIADAVVGLFGHDEFALDRDTA